jgi:lipopolysaccharide transport system ATP-binding protein
MNPIIKVEQISKQYQLGTRDRHTSLRDAITGRARAAFGSRSDAGQSRPNGTIWALTDVSFEVQAGEVVGIIGRNGAGKSTLLKILSRITKPTKGRVTLSGRIGSLLEVGTGFHSELTGRENIFLNGAILGMSKREIQSKFDEIVAFAETEQFLDTPLKHYSSGMAVRLAFAVAAHLEPEILIIDEVLAVGDVSFQKKCLGKMNEVARAGRTILFVSHDINAVNALCKRTLLLHDGAIVRSGPTRDVTAYYLDRANQLYSPITWAAVPRGASNEIKIHAALVKQRGRQSAAIDCREPFTIFLEYENLKAVPSSRFFVLIRNDRGEVVFTTSDYDEFSERNRDRKVGKFVSEITMPAELFKAGTYYATVGADIKNQRIIFANSDIVQFEVYESADDTIAERHKRPGLIAPVLHWQISESDSRQQS